MRFLARASWLSLLALPALAGCAQNSLALQGQVQTLQQQQLALNQRNEELQSRASTLDKDNQELQTLLSQSQQQQRLLDDQLAVLREQLSSATTQLAKAKQLPVEAEKRTEAWNASTKSAVGAKITNNGLREKLPAVNIPGVNVRPDGDVVRIELPASRLFLQGTARLMPEGSTLIETVAAEIARTYPEQLIGVEGHTDSDPVPQGRWQSNHQLSIGEALAVYDHMTTRTSLRANQLFVMGLGGNRPVVSNGTAAGKERNRRVELVIYPERATTR
jgi:flagellar motor protein MotB